MGAAFIKVRHFWPGVGPCGVAPSFSCDRIPFKFGCYLGGSYGRTSAYLHCQLCARVPTTYRAVEVVGPICTTAVSSIYPFFVPSGGIQCTLNVARLLSRIPCDSTIDVGERVLTRFGRTACCHYHHGRQVLSPSRRRCVHGLFIDGKVGRLPMCSRCVRGCS